MDSPIIKLIAILIIPLIPSLAILKLLPDSKINVRGPFQRFKINITGSFAAYFLLVIIAISIWPKPSEKELLWAVHGKIQASNVSVKNTLTVEYTPPMLYPDDVGNFVAYIAKHVRPNGSQSFPSLTFKAPLTKSTWGTAAVQLEDPTAVTVDEKKREIIIRNPIVLTRIPSDEEVTPQELEPITN